MTQEFDLSCPYCNEAWLAKDSFTNKYIGHFNIPSPLPKPLEIFYCGTTLIYSSAGSNERIRENDINTIDYYLGRHELRSQTCNKCLKTSIFLCNYETRYLNHTEMSEYKSTLKEMNAVNFSLSGMRPKDKDMKTFVLKKRMIVPSTGTRTCPDGIPEHIKKDFKEACLTLEASYNASAALSRRCLQNLLRETHPDMDKELKKAKGKKPDLYYEIDYVIENDSLGSQLSESLSAIRVIGNYSAHPTKNSNPGQLTEASAEEAEWCLTILEDLFDFYYVQPEIHKQKMEKLNQKLKSAGKKPLTD